MRCNLGGSSCTVGWVKIILNYHTSLISQKKEMKENNKELQTVYTSPHARTREREPPPPSPPRGPGGRWISLSVAFVTPLCLPREQSNHGTWEGQTKRNRNHPTPGKGPSAFLLRLRLFSLPTPNIALLPCRPYKAKPCRALSVLPAQGYRLQNQKQPWHWIFVFLLSSSYLHSSKGFTYTNAQAEAGLGCGMPKQPLGIAVVIALLVFVVHRAVVDVFNTQGTFR